MNKVMKTNEAPEKIYISNFDIEVLPRNEQLSERWHEVSTQDTDIEYTRTDAFIEKAKKWFEEHFGNRLKWEITTYEFEDIQSMIEDFRKYMEGE